MRDRQTMARRVRGYVIAGKTSHSVSGGPAATGRASTRERKALATMGRKGGKKAAQRWQDDPDGDYARSELEKLKEANKQRKRQGNSTRARVLALATDALAQTGKVPSGRAIGTELGITKRSANLHLRALREAGLLEE